jgi:hypothetical protein
MAGLVGRPACLLRIREELILKEKIVDLRSRNGMLPSNLHEQDTK